MQCNPPISIPERWHQVNVISHMADLYLRDMYAVRSTRFVNSEFPTVHIRNDYQIFRLNYFE